MKRRMLCVATIALLSALVLGGTALAQPGPDRMGPPPGRGGPGERPGPPPGMGAPGGGLFMPPPEAFERLGLSEAQRGKLETLRDGERRRAIRADAEIRLAEMDLVKLVESEKPDATAINNAIENLMKMRAEQLKGRAEAIVAMRAVLTPEQRAKLRRPDPDARWH